METYTALDCARARAGPFLKKGGRRMYRCSITASLVEPVAPRTSCAVVELSCHAQKSSDFEKRKNENILRLSSVKPPSDSGLQQGRYEKLYYRLRRFLFASLQVESLLRRPCRRLSIFFKRATSPL